MKEHNNVRRGFTLGLAAVAGLSVAAFGVVGIAERVDLTAQQQDVALTANAADAAHEALISAQVGQDHSLFSNDVALQQSIFYWVTEAKANGGLGLPSSSLFPGSTVDPENSIFNGAFSRFTESQLVSQALQQVQYDHMLGVNQTLGVGGYETEIANALYSDLSGAGIPDKGALFDAVNALDLSATGHVDVTSFSAFQGALNTLDGALMQSAWSDLFGMFSIGDATP